MNPTPNMSGPFAERAVKLTVALGVGMNGSCDAAAGMKGSWPHGWGAVSAAVAPV